MTQWSWAAKIVKVHGVGKLSAMVARGESLQTFYNSMSKGKDVGPGSETNSADKGKADDKGNAPADDAPKTKTGDKSAQEVLADILALSERLGRMIDAGEVVTPAMLQQVGKSLGKVARANEANKVARAKRQASAAINA